MKKKKGKNIKKEYEGIIFLSRKGTGYVSTSDLKEDIEIDFKNLNTALHRDKVRVSSQIKVNEKLKGKIIEITKRDKKNFVGILEKDKDIFFLNPDDSKMYRNILIPKKYLNKAKEGEKIYVEIISWKDRYKSPIGKVIKILGKPGKHDVEIKSIAIEKGFNLSFSKKIEEEARKISERGILTEDYKGRKDFRKTLTFTIDPDDAKDFDDAISFKEIKKGVFEIGIHIADVTFYLKEGSLLDKEARKRGTSVYLVDRTIPMLPEVLSNNLCSLVPQKDRLTMSVVFEINKEGKILSQWYGRSIIKSAKRFTYKEALKTIKNEDVLFHKELDILNKIAHKLKNDRYKKGAISLEQDEVKFIFDKKGNIIDIIKKQRNDAHKLVEEFMLLANRKVAEKMSIQKNGADFFVYRIHDYPDKEKSINLSLFLESIGYNLELKNETISNKQINKVLKELKEKENKNTINRIIIRSMAKAIYSSKNIGHYGLAFEYYTHFTSPIRRYPDVIVHRLLNTYLKGNKISKQKKKEYENIIKDSTEQEKRATEAERNSIKYKQIEYLQNKINKTFEGIITGVSEWGLYVEEINSRTEGMIKLKNLDDDFYILNKKKLELIGKNTGKKYKFGDKIKIKIKKINLEKREIDYIIKK